MPVAAASSSTIASAVGRIAPSVSRPDLDEPPPLAPSRGADLDRREVSSFVRSVRSRYRLYGTLATVVGLAAGTVAWVLA